MSSHFIRAPGLCRLGPLAAALFLLAGCGGAAATPTTAAKPLSYRLNLKLADPSAADSFASAYDNSHASAPAPFLNSWENIGFGAGNLVRNEQRALMIGSWLLGLLAVASVAVLVGGRMTEQTRRVGLLKAVGSTPGLVAAVTLAAERDLQIPADKVNIYGGAIALGHPIGCSGARILVTLLNGLKRTGGRRGIACLCIGGGEAVALAVEMLS